MSLSVVEKKSTFNSGKGGIVVVRSDKAAGNLAIEELHSAAAKNLAIQHAQTTQGQGYGISGTISIYPVDAQGNEMKEIKADVQPAAYHGDYPVTPRFA